jgi:hypothetical protein
VILPQAGSCKHFHGQLKIDASEHLKRLLEEFLELHVVTNCIDACKEFKIKYHNGKLLKKFENHQLSTPKNSTFNLIVLQRKQSIS